MPDKLGPSSQTDPVNPPVSESPQPHVQGNVSTTAPAPAEPPGITLGDQLRYWALYVGLLAGLWAAAFIVLLVMGQRTRDAVGFATVIAIVGSFFTRSLLPQLADRHRPSTQPQHVDSAREIIETVVFVVVLVLLLKSFTAEAFVIPTGSMAETLWGYQKVVTCPQCQLEFPVNCSSEVDPSDGSEPIAVRGCTCPNCRQDISFYPPQQQGQAPPQVGLIRDPGWRSGDRVLVAKFVYDLLEKEPNRLDVVVFKFPGDREGFPYSSGPVKRHVPINYIKRLVGLPGETIALHRGKLWVLAPEKDLRYSDFDDAAGDPGKLAQLWRLRYTHHDDEKARERWDRNEFEIVRKSPDVLLAMRRLVYDHDHQAQDLLGPEFQRWLPVSDSGWAASGKTGFRSEGKEATGWLRYRHVLRHNPDRPQLITDFMGYNTWAGGNSHVTPRENWASDLMVECEVAVEKGTGRLLLELSRGTDRFQAAFDLASGECTLYRLEKGKEPAALGSARTTLKGTGTHLVRFANIDDRLVVWVDERLPFGDGVSYPAVKNLAPTRENDLERPVSIGTAGAQVAVSKLKVFRDTYYTTARGDRPSEPDVPEFRPDDPESWLSWEKAPVSTYYVQPGHYLCLGDNSPESSDGRSWGLVPRRLLLGRALLVYYPFSRTGRIR